MRLDKVVACRLTLREWEAFKALCRKNKVNYQIMFHSIITDALVEEGYDALRCQQSKGCQTGGETSETCGAATP